MSADPAPVERLHPLMLLTGLGGSLRRVVGGYAALGYLAATGKPILALAIGAGLLAIVLTGLLLSWRRFTFRVGPDDIRIDSGVLSRTHRSIPFDRVQDVDIEQGPVARLLGLARVKFETGASAGSGADEGVLPVIALTRAEALRDHVRARHRGVAETASAVSEPDRPIFAMAIPRVLAAGLFNFSLAIFAGMVGLTQTLGDVIGFDPLKRAFWSSLLSRNDILVNYAAAHRSIAVLAGLGLLIVLGSLTGIVRTLLLEWRFRLDRSANGLRRRRGLLTLTDVTIPLRRVQAALIVTGPVRVRFGWRTLKFQSLGSDAADKGDHVMAPLATSDEVALIIDELGWPRIQEGALDRVSPAYIWTHLLGLAPVALMVVLAVGSLAVARATEAPTLAPAPTLAVAAAAAVALCVSALARILSWRHTGYLLENDQLAICSGWWNRRFALLPARRVQSIDLKQNLFERRFGIVRMQFGVAGGRGFSGHVIPALPHHQALALRRALLASAT